MEWIKDIVFSPSLFLVIVVCLILLKALIETSKKAKSSDREAIPMTISDSRLKIISAYYGVEGGPDANVADDYINPKIQGHSLAGWVGADLFGGFQPVIGREKRVKVRYSFDGVETTIERPEHALLVLPEDKFLKEQIEMLRRHLSAQVVITGLLQGDPELEISFSNDLQGALTVVNRGAEDIYGIRVFPIQTAARILNFDYIEAELKPNETTHFAPHVGDQWGTDRNHDFLRALSENWAKTRASSAIREASCKAKLEYENSKGVHFEVSFEILYHTTGTEKEATCKDFFYRRIPPGITPQ